MRKNFYIHLDAVLDTRAGVIRRMDPEKHAEIIRNGYHQRKSDFFPGIDREAFLALYKAKESDTLVESTVTNIFYFLYPQIVDIMKETSTLELPDHMKPQLDVNIWPYDLTDDEKADLRAIVALYTRRVIGVNIINESIQAMTPGRCWDKYMMMITYDFEEWLNTHSNELIKEPKPWLVMVAPMSYLNRDPDKDPETIDSLKQGINSLALLGAALAPRLGLKFVNVDLFSIAYPDDRLVKIEEITTAQTRTIEELDRELVKHREKNGIKDPEPD